MGQCPRDCTHLIQGTRGPRCARGGTAQGECFAYRSRPSRPAQDLKTPGSLLDEQEAALARADPTLGFPAWAEKHGLTTEDRARYRDAAAIWDEAIRQAHYAAQHGIPLQLLASRVLNAHQTSVLLHGGRS